MNEKLGIDLMDAAFAVHNVLHKAEQALRHLEHDKKINENCLFQMQELAKETNKAINNLKHVVDAQGQKGCWDVSPYHTGLYNGLEMALAMFEKREPKFRLVPNGVGSDRQFPKSSAHDYCYYCDEVVDPTKHECSKVSTSSDDVLGAYEYTIDRGKVFQEQQAVMTPSKCETGELKSAEVLK